VSAERDVAGGATWPQHAVLRTLVPTAGFVVSMSFLWFAVRGIDRDEFWLALRNSSFGWLLIAVAALAASVVVRVVRWLYLFEPAKRVPARAATRALLVGELLNSLVPVRAGEVARVVVLHRDTGASRAETTGTLVAERLMDMLALLVLFFAAVPALPEVTWLWPAAVMLASVAIAIAAVIVVVRAYGDRPFALALRPLGRLLGVAPARVEMTAARTLEGVRAFRDFRAGVLAFVLSLVVWLAVAACFWSAMRAVAVDTEFEAAILVVFATTFALVLPSLPAGVGVFEAATFVSLRAFGVADAQALACAVVLHVLSFAPFIVAGVVALRLRSLGRAP
jgi:glycosyltransferase 2 family protein